jgi:hypothetical protein
MVTLTFDTEHDYTVDAQIGITIPVELTAGTEQVSLFAKLDTGASFCIFQRDYGEQLGLTVQNGHREVVRLANGDSFETFGHEVTVRSLGHQFNSIVYFASDPSFARNVVGRRGWVQQFRIALIDYDCRLYVSPYNAP